MNKYLSRNTRSFILFIIINLGIFYYLYSSEYWVEIFGETKIRLFFIPLIPLLLGMASNVLHNIKWTKHLLIIGVFTTGIAILIPILRLGFSLMIGGGS